MTFHSRTLAILASAILVPTAGAATIGGRVFEDFNANGSYDTGSTTVANDVGVAGVALAVTNARGKSIARVVTGVDGTWTAQAPAGWFRITAKELPPGYEPGPHGANSGTTAQFVNTADTVADDHIDIGIAQPSNYCEDNPNLALPCARSQSAKIDQGAFFLFPLSASSDPDGNPDGSYTGNDRILGTRPTVLALASQVGMLNGVAWNRREGTLYGSAYLRRRTGFGPGGIGAIYAVTNPGTPGAPVTTFVDLNAVFGAGTAGVDPHVPGDLIDDGASVPLVGKAGIGDIDISPDGRTLYAMNLTDRKLLRHSDQRHAHSRDDRADRSAPGPARLRRARRAAIRPRGRRRGERLHRRCLQRGVDRQRRGCPRLRLALQRDVRQPRAERPAREGRRGLQARLERVGEHRQRPRPAAADAERHRVRPRWSDPRLP